MEKNTIKKSLKLWVKKIQRYSDKMLTNCWVNVVPAPFAPFGYSNWTVIINKVKPNVSDRPHIIKQMQVAQWIEIEASIRSETIHDLLSDMRCTFPRSRSKSPSLYLIPLAGPPQPYTFYHFPQLLWTVSLLNWIVSGNWTTATMVAAKRWKACKTFVATATWESGGVAVPMPVPQPNQCPVATWQCGMDVAATVDHVHFTAENVLFIKLSDKIVARWLWMSFATFRKK